MNKKIKKIITFLFFQTLFVGSFSVKSLGAEKVHLDQPVSLRVEVKYSEEPLADVVYSLYEVGDYLPDGSLLVKDSFANFREELADWSKNTGLANRLAAFAKEEKLKDEDCGKTDANGVIQFPLSKEKLTPGLYLLTTEGKKQDKITYEMAPLLISLPYYDELLGDLKYDVVSKVKCIKIEEIDIPWDNPGKKITKTFFAPPDVPELPQMLPVTGLVWWPVPLLIVLAMICFLFYKRKVSRRKALGSFGILLLVGAFAVVLMNFSNDMNGGKTSQKEVQQLEEHIADRKREKIDEYIAAGADYLTRQDAVLGEDLNSGTLEISVDLNQVMPEEEMDGQRYIGLLEIPSLSLELPVISQYSDEALSVAPARFSGSLYQDNLIIAAHNYQSHFGRLPELRENDVIRFTDVNGSTYSYVVSGLEQMDRTEVSRMVQGDWDLTLFTCVPLTTCRLAVRCKRV